MCLVGVAGRYLGAWVGVTWSKAPRINRDLIAIAHTPGGMMEIVVALLAMESGLITPVVFVAIVFSAVFSSVIMGPWMSRSVARRAKVSPLDFLRRGNLVPALHGDNRNEVMRKLAERIAQAAGIGSVEQILRPALEREEAYGTAVGHQLAIPHARIKGLDDPVIAFGRLTHGIDWDAPDGEPVTNVFFLATPEGAEDVHVQILSAISRAMQPEANRRRVHEARDTDELRSVLGRILRQGAG